MRQFLDTINGSLYIPKINNSIPTLLRGNNEPIMDKGLSGRAKTSMQRINRVRIWMGVYSIAEIANASGTQISRDAWEGTRKRHTEKLWPYQPKPGPKSFRSWRRYLADHFLKGHRPRVSKKTADLILLIPLWTWKHSSK